MSCGACRFVGATCAECELTTLRAELAALKAAHAALCDAAKDLSTVGMAAFGELHNFARDLDVISSADNTAVRHVASKLRDAIERTDAALVTEEK